MSVAAIIWSQTDAVWRSCRQLKAPTAIAQLWEGNHNAFPTTPITSDLANTGLAWEFPTTAKDIAALEPGAGQPLGFLPANYRPGSTTLQAMAVIRACRNEAALLHLGGNAAPSAETRPGGTADLIDLLQNWPCAGPN